jgi:hypothetical protein
MKKLLLSFLTVAAINFASNAQSCTPGANFADSTYGVWPDTVQNFPPGQPNVPYSTDLNFKVPSTVTAEVAGTDPIAIAVIGSQIQGFVVNDVMGLPTGFNYACNISGCSYSGGANGCANVYGTNGIAGTYPLTIKITATVLVNIPLIGPTPQSVPQEFSGYRIVLGTAGTIEQFISPITVSPNPANDIINIDGITSSTKANSVSIVNLEGKVIAMKEVTTGTNVSFDLTDVKSGLYFVNVAHASGVETVKFIKE